MACLAGVLLTMQACSSDGKKESRTEDALEKAGDAFAADAKDAQVRAKEKIREADEKLTSKSKEAGAGLRHDGNVVLANLKARAREMNAKEKVREADEKLTASSKEAAAGFRHDREVVMANIRKRTRELDAKIKELHAQARRDEETQQRLNKLRDERDDLNDDLGRAKNSTADAWQDVKKSFKRAED